MNIKTLALIVSSSFSFCALAAPQAQVEGGILEGFVENNMIQYLGVPYAKAPLGELRWKGPQKLDHWSGIKKATKFSSQCVQNKDLGVFSKAGGSEDCLYLNIYKKDTISSDKKPVLFWIHGGGLMVGSGSDYNPELLVKDEDIIVVTFNYRLGSFGFISQTGLDAEKDEIINYGFMDQTAALKWVYDNIESFGGDKENITIAGESSGGHSVYTQMVAPSARNLFKNAIVMSGGNVVNKHGEIASYLEVEDARKLGDGLAQALNCDVKDTKCLRSKSAEEIKNIQSPYIIRTQIIDGKYLPMPYATAFEKGEFSKVPLIVGSNKDEGDFFASNVEELTGTMMDEELFKNAVRGLAGNKADKIFKEYKLEDYVNPAEAFSAIATDAIFACPQLKLNKILAKQIPLFAYEFSDRTAPSYMPDLSFNTRAFHTSEIPYIFKGFNGDSTKSTELNPLQKELSKQLVKIWAKPESVKDLDWNQFDDSKQNYMTFKLPKSQMLSGSFEDYHKCKFWTEYGLY